MLNLNHKELSSRSVEYRKQNPATTFIIKNVGPHYCEPQYNNIKKLKNDKLIMINALMTTKAH